MSESNSSSGGIGFFGGLGLLFIGLKLGGVINWSWWYVTLPLWGGAVLVITIAVMVLIGAAFMQIAKSILERSRRRHW